MLIIDTENAFRPERVAEIAVKRFGLEALEESALVEWEVTPAKDMNAQAMTLTSVAGAQRRPFRRPTAAPS